MIEEITKLMPELMELKEAYAEPELEVITDTAIVICSDARIPVSAVSDGRFYIIENAGNLFDFAAIPRGIDNVLVVGHNTEQSKGCGACGAAAGLRSLSPEELNKKRKEMPGELFYVALTALPTPETNQLNVIKQFRDFGYVTGQAMINNATCELSGFGNNDTPGLNGARNSMLEANEMYRKEVHPDVLKTGYPIAKSQNPSIISLTTLDRPLAEYLGGRFAQANMIFEAKGRVPTDIMIGSAQYAWEHYKGHDDNFSTTDISILSASTEGRLVKIVNRLREDTALKGYIKKGGRVYGMAVDGQGMRFYNIRWH